MSLPESFNPRGPHIGPKIGPGSGPTSTSPSAVAPISGPICPISGPICPVSGPVSGPVSASTQPITPALTPISIHQFAPVLLQNDEDKYPKMSSKITTKEQAQAILDQYDYFLFDCDGVIWLGDHLLPSVAETLALLKKTGKTVLFVTNNSTKARKDYLSKFEKLGISGIQKSEVFGSSYASAVYVDKILQLPKDKKVWVLGESGIETELHELGYKTVGGTDPALVENGVAFNPESTFLTDLDPDVGCVVAGLTTNINYLKLSATMQYLLKDNKSIPFVATNIDSTFPSKGKLLIGAGSIVETVSYASGRKPDAICGKPNQSMMQSILADNQPLKENPKKGLMVGDRLNTDMKFGRDGGLDTLLVLTGIETQDVVESLGKEEAPTYFADKLGDLYELTQ